MCVEYCIVRHPYLMKNRHLDHLLMSSIYACCRVTDQEIMFKLIVAAYKEMPHASQQVCRFITFLIDQHQVSCLCKTG